MRYFHVDVFANGPFTGNGLSVLICDAFPSKARMQAIASELKQYESIFLVPDNDCECKARIFTVDEELPFAGHPLLGAAAVMHQVYHSDNTTSDVTFRLQNNHIHVTTKSCQDSNDISCTMDQGKIQFLGSVPHEKYAEYLAPLNLTETDLADHLPLEVLSAGLPYLFISVNHGLEEAGIHSDDYEERLAKIGAKFMYLFDVNKFEGRTWDNLGKLEDVATGSAAGPLVEYLVRHGICQNDQEIDINQGRFLGRPSKLHVIRQSATGSILVRGNVTILSSGKFLV